ncbi:hypothetical protein [Escherichia phage pEC-M2929-1AR.1]|nr:hypothetical protein [Escherichia phage pEC-M2929-1AR.1]
MNRWFFILLPQYYPYLLQCTSLFVEYSYSLFVVICCPNYCYLLSLLF